tara:strand:+ start:1230 stop:1709 length:480 start_codon:yes stop_codon:yes gene_type:complete
MSDEYIEKYIDEFCMNYYTIKEYKVQYIKDYFYKYLKDIIYWSDGSNKIYNLVIGTLYENKYIYFKSKTNKNHYDVIYIRKENKFKKYNLLSNEFDDISNNIIIPKLYEKKRNISDKYSTILSYPYNNLEVKGNYLEYDKNSLLKNSYNKNKKMCCFIL